MTRFLSTNACAFRTSPVRVVRRPPNCKSAIPHSAIRPNRAIIADSAPLRMTLPKHTWFWNPRPIRTRASPPQALASDARSAVGRRVSTTSGLVTAATYGIRSIGEECAPRVSTAGRQPSVSRVRLVAAFRLVFEMTKSPSKFRSHTRFAATSDASFG
jgi:hypothetical protein